ncbi:hypothetical protein NIASO_17655 [Niabella soli DSM 19437]|uniref:Uncharacterized protein n=1 Tax=Niabella soli DSM 19437 TaxID=929713 RepID=W0F4F8_9BACT|nr:hypothetical protein NIASO_17655 [Niabella soli DSM 19437]
MFLIEVESIGAYSPKIFYTGPLYGLPPTIFSDSLKETALICNFLFFIFCLLK